MVASYQSKLSQFFYVVVIQRDGLLSNDCTFGRTGKWSIAAGDNNHLLGNAPIGHRNLVRLFDDGPTTEVSVVLRNCESTI